MTSSIMKASELRLRSRRRTEAKILKRKGRLLRLGRLKASRMGWIWASGRRYPVYADPEAANYPW